MGLKFLKINPADNVAVAIDPLKKGVCISVDGKEIFLQEDIPAGHKVALKDFAENEDIIKYGYAIGHARCAITKGAWVNERNIKTNLEGVLEYSYSPKLAELNIPNRNLSFMGYRRKTGEVGIRNEIWVIPTVGCVNGIVNRLADSLRRETGEVNVDAIVAFPHNYGCSQLGNDH